ncbi:MAG: DUF885 domain-containing protein [Rhodoglobus sp.]|tara:strand:- start:8232 stop:9899 length:1668 start_codon:yes stop_codon:yes gene_type:complete
MHVSPRQPSPIDDIAEQWADTVVQLNPSVGTTLGRAESNSLVGDYSPAGLEAQRSAARATLLSLENQRPRDAVDDVTRRDLSAQLQLHLESADAQLPLRNLNVIASPAQEVRSTFDLLPKTTEADWATIATRLNGVPAALAGYTETLRTGIRSKTTPALRQVRAVAAQAASHSGTKGFFATLAAEATTASPSLRADLTAAAERAAGAYSELSTFLTGELAPVSSVDDAVGREHYELSARGFLGAVVDLDESYEWGREELALMTEEQERVAQEIVPGGSVSDAIAVLDADPERVLHGTDALQRWMQDISDRAVAELAGTHFTIPPKLQRLECRIAPTHEGKIYYTGPSDDFSRPGQMWWSVPPGVTTFNTWRELTTVYHEGVPGHHLQMGTGALRSDSLNTWRRQLAFTSGHAEGWALYAERLMEQLGYLDDPASRLGMLDAQRMRAARVVVDLGVHLGKQRPDGTGIWDASYALSFMKKNVHMNDAAVRFEVDRYLGWPGQAPSYKLGQRLWEQLRDDAALREGPNFDIRNFHREALDLGSLGLGTLGWALRRRS